ncbi:LD-carboxypeptidase, partial [Lactobacillus sp. XV13L]|nr:LD-carboxypeptidase [Lactobacillus sp. XV13L]
LHKGDQVAIVSLSQGTLGENFAHHQRQLGIQRLQEFGLRPVFMDNTLRGINYLKTHPQARAQDLKQAFADEQIKGIFAAIGGEDAFKLAPYLLEDEKFKQNVLHHPKLFSGFSDTTVNHLMFYQIGMQSFYGPNFLNDLAELGPQLLPYTKRTLEHYFVNSTQTTVEASTVWYEERTDFSAAQVGTLRPQHKDEGYVVLRGHGLVEGRLLGGCIETLTDLLVGSRYHEEIAINSKYQIFPSVQEWQDKILFIETSENQPTPDKYRKLLNILKTAGVLQAVKAIIVGKPQNKKYYTEYQQVLLDMTDLEQTPILYNCNFGHAYPRAALPYGAQAQIDFYQRSLTIIEPWFQDVD